MGALAVADDRDEDREAIIGGLPANHSFSEIRRFSGENEILAYIAELEGEDDDELPSLFIVDLQMENNDSGQRVLEAVRNSSTLRHTPILIASVNDRRKVIRALYALGLNSYVSKGDAEPEQLTEVFESVFAYWTTYATLP